MYVCMYIKVPYLLYTVHDDLHATVHIIYTFLYS